LRHVFAGVPTFELFADRDKTKLILTHEGLGSFIPEKHPELAKENFMQGWTQFMDRTLKEFLEKAATRQRWRLFF
jgi:hypothetical protein